MLQDDGERVRRTPGFPGQDVMLREYEAQLRDILESGLDQFEESERLSPTELLSSFRLSDSIDLGDIGRCRSLDDKEPRERCQSELAGRITYPETRERPQSEMSGRLPAYSDVSTKIVGTPGGSSSCSTSNSSDRRRANLTNAIADVSYLVCAWKH